SYLLDDAAREISIFKDELSFEPERLEQIETRLDLVSKLKRKYGEGIEQILAFRQEAAATLERISNSKERVEELEVERGGVYKKFHVAAQKLRALRLEKGQKLAAEAENHIRDLGMKNARLVLDVKTLGSEGLSTSGTEKVELLFSANLGEEPKPLSKIASGGEMSRVMLGLKAVFSQLDSIPTLVFDEIDSGVGGKAAQAVAEKIARVAIGKQVLCVTHLPQIAAVAQTHFYIQKHTQGERTVTTLSALDGTTRVQELARMLSGDESQVALQHAQELLNKHHKN
ncbi:MAG: DNA repair protein RecN, partial [Bacillota bacterium]|nr:DNA repair protein RecN [Bacillota bacterium]